jgi:hypothetical protein
VKKRRKKSRKPAAPGSMRVWFNMQAILERTADAPVHELGARQAQNGRWRGNGGIKVSCEE